MSHQTLLSKRIVPAVVPERVSVCRHRFCFTLLVRRVQRTHRPVQTLADLSTFVLALVVDDYKPCFE